MKELTSALSCYLALASPAIVTGLLPTPDAADGGVDSREGWVPFAGSWQKERERREGGVGGLLISTAT